MGETLYQKEAPGLHDWRPACTSDDRKGSLKGMDGFLPCCAFTGRPTTKQVVSSRRPLVPGQEPQRQTAVQEIRHAASLPAAPTPDTR